MFKCFENFGKFEFYAEKRLLFEDRPKEQPPTPEAVQKSVEKQLARLQAKVGKPGGEPSQKPAETTGTPPNQPTTYHTERLDTRPLERPKQTYPDSVKEVTDALAMEGYLSKKEIEKIQQTHEHLYEQYLNPAFMLYLKQRGPELYDKVYTALDLILKNPYDFEYVSKGDKRFEKENQRFEIVKRRPYKKNSIPDNFSVIIETDAGYITGVNGTNLKTPTGAIPWMPNPEYNKRMAHYRAQWQNEKESLEPNIEKNPDDPRIKNLPPVGTPERAIAWKKFFIESPHGVSEDMKELFALDNIEFPKRLVKLIEARGLPFEMQDPRFIGLRERQKDQAKTYEELVETPFKKNKKVLMLVVADSEIEGCYYIYMKPYKGLSIEPFRVTKDGFILKDMGEKASPRWAVDPLYDHALRRRYYRENEGAEKRLTADEKKELEEEEKRKIDEEKRRSEEKEKNKKDNDARLKEAEEKRPKVDEALKKAKLPILKQVAKAIPINESGDTKRQANIDAEKDPKVILTFINKILDVDEDGSSIIKAAEILVEAPAKLRLRSQVETALKTANLLKLGEVAKAISPESFQSAIDQLIAGKFTAEKKKKGLLYGIKKVLNSDNVGKAAEILIAPQLKLQEARKKRPQIDEALKTMDLEGLRELAKAVPINKSANTVRQAKFDAEEKPEKLRAVIKKILNEDKDGSSINKVAEILGVEGPVKEAG